MKCPTCGTYTRILETRVNPKGIRRRYECANLHRFTTQETLIPTPGIREQIEKAKHDKTTQS